MLLPFFISQKTLASIKELLKYVKSVKFEHATHNYIDKSLKEINKGIEQELETDYGKNKIRLYGGSELYCIVKYLKDGSPSIADDKPRVPIYKTHKMASAAMRENGYEEPEYKISACKVVYNYNPNKK